MRQEMIVTGKDIPEAIANARALLLKDTPEAELRYEILETGSRGIFGGAHLFGAERDDSL